VFFSRRVTDLDASARFYRSALGADERSGAHELGARFQLLAGGVQPPVYTNRDQALCTPLFRSFDADGSVARCLAAGARVLNDFTKDYNRLVYLSDPEGRVFGVNHRWETSPREHDRVAYAESRAGWSANGPHPLCWVVRRGPDIDALIAAEAAGLEPEAPRTELGQLFWLTRQVVLEIARAGDGAESVTTDSYRCE
jgi:predicted enzyme related to lactoylglutathione lyase